jgi:hypothetical protein
VDLLRRIDRRHVAVLLLAGMTAGCFTYVPAQLETTPPGENVRVLVTRQGASELASVTTVAGDVPSMDGSVVGTEGTDLLLRVAVGERREGFIASSLNQTVRVPVGEILSFQRREVDKLRTGLLVGVAAGVATAVVVFILDPFGSRDPPSGPDPDELRLDMGVFTIPVGE